MISQDRKSIKYQEFSFSQRKTSRDTDASTERFEKVDVSIESFDDEDKDEDLFTIILKVKKRKSTSIELKMTKRFFPLKGKMILIFCRQRGVRKK